MKKRKPYVADPSIDLIRTGFGVISLHTFYVTVFFCGLGLGYLLGAL